MDSWALYYFSGRLYASIAVLTGLGDVYANVPISMPWVPERDRWYHLALSYDRAQLRLYLDGSLVATIAETRPLAYDGHPVLLGADIEFETPSYFWGGKTR